MDFESPNCLETKRFHFWNERALFLITHVSFRCVYYVGDHDDDHDDDHCDDRNDDHADDHGDEHHGGCSDLTAPGS